MASLLSIFRTPLRASISQLRPSITSTRLLSEAAQATAEPDATEGENNIRQKLEARFKPTRLQVQDVSGGCGTFYAIAISSPEFKGIPMVQQHRLVTEELKKEIEGIHGLQIKTMSA